MGLLGLMCAMPALVQAETLNVNIPFSFIADNTTLPAGAYELSWPIYNDNMLMEIRSQDTDRAVFVPTELASPPQGQSSKSKLIFDKIGNQEFLSQVWRDDGSLGYTVPKSKQEILAKHDAAMKVAHHSAKAHVKTHVS